MKTSLQIDDRVFRAAKREADRKGTTLSALISYWARVGFEALQRAKRKHRRVLKSVSLGGSARVDFSSRRDWMDLLDT